MWQAYAWNARVGPDLLADAKDLLLETFARLAELGEQQDHLVHLFVSIAIHSPGGFAPEEISNVVRQLDEDGLVYILDTFARFQAGSDVARARIWTETIEPWLVAYWPTGAERNTARTARGLATLAIGAGSAFMRAVDTVRAYLSPVDDVGRLLWQIEHDEAGPLGGRDPGRVLELLSLVVGEVDPWAKDSLRKVLDDVARISPELREDPRWQRLMRVALN